MLNLWNSARKGNDYNFMDRVISDYFNRSGPSIYIHVCIGTYGSDVDVDGNPISTSADSSSTDASTSIQDPILMENRDRQYDPNVKELHGVFQITDYEFALAQFGTFLSNDTLFIEFHMNDMLAAIGRKIIAGDVVELPNMRDDALIGETGAANKYYVVTEGKRAPGGYQATWMPHIWRIKCEPMTASQEFADILNQPTQNPFGIDTGTTLGQIISTASSLTNVNEQIVLEAEAMFLRRNFETRQYWIVPGDGNQAAWVFAGDGIPPNGAQLSGYGNDYPANPNDGDFYLRTDMSPNMLYRFEHGTWCYQESDYRQIWTAAPRIMLSFVNNRQTITFPDGTTQPSKQILSEVVSPAADMGNGVHPGDAVDFPFPLTLK